MDNWYTKKQSSARDNAIEQIKELIDSLYRATMGSSIDKVKSKRIVENILKKINRERGERIVIRVSLQNMIKETLESVKSVIWDSPDKFNLAIFNLIDVLSGHLYEMESKHGNG